MPELIFSKVTEVLFSGSDRSTCDGEIGSETSLTFQLRTIISVRDQVPASFHILRRL